MLGLGAIGGQALCDLPVAAAAAGADYPSSYVAGKFVLPLTLSPLQTRYFSYSDDLPNLTYGEPLSLVIGQFRIPPFPLQKFWPPAVDAPPPPDVPPTSVVGVFRSVYKSLQPQWPLAADLNLPPPDNTPNFIVGKFQLVYRPLQPRWPVANDTPPIPPDVPPTSVVGVFRPNYKPLQPQWPLTDDIPLPAPDNTPNFIVGKFQPIYRPLQAKWPVNPDVSLPAPDNTPNFIVGLFRPNYKPLQPQWALATDVNVLPPPPTIDVPPTSIVGAFKNWPLPKTTSTLWQHGSHWVSYLVYDRGTFTISVRRSPAYILAQYLIQNGYLQQPPVVTLTAWPGFVGSMPEDGDLAVCVYDTAGVLDGRYMRTGEFVNHHGLQIRARASDYLTAYNKLAILADVCDTIKQQPLILPDGTKFTIIAISRRGTIMSLGEEKERHRQLFVLNLTITIK